MSLWRDALAAELGGFRRGYVPTEPDKTAAEELPSRHPLTTTEADLPVLSVLSEAHGNTHQTSIHPSGKADLSLGVDATGDAVPAPRRKPTEPTEPRAYAHACARCGRHAFPVAGVVCYWCLYGRSEIAR
jgi:hypothetical protein